MPLKLKVPYSEKNEAKSMGAKWDAFEKTWFVPDEIDYNKFSKWFGNKEIDILLKPPFYLAKNNCECWRCEKEISVVSLCSGSFKIVENMNMEDYDGFAFFSNVTYLPEEIIKILKTHFPAYYYDYSKTINQKYWANHCPYCRALQGDFFLYSEPGGAFCPIDEDSMKNLLLIKLPPKYDEVLSCEFGQSSIFDEILNYALIIDLEKYGQKG